MPIVLTRGSDGLYAPDDLITCSGCITSAEGVLISQQSKEEFLNQLAINSELKAKEPESAKTIIISLAPQVRASLAAYFSLSTESVGFYFSILSSLDL